MSAGSIESFLDSDLAAQDPTSMFSVFQKMDDNTFDSAIASMNKKMVSATYS